MEIICQISKYRGVQGIYAIVNVNKKSDFCSLGTPYVGQTIAKPTAKKHRLGIGHRLGDHRFRLRKGVHHNPKLQNAWNKYGEASFVFVLLEKVDKAERLTEREQYWMDTWKAYSHGYNCQPIADSAMGHKLRSTLTDEIVKNWIKQFREDHGEWPQSLSGIIAYAPPDEPITWGGLDRSMADGFRGFKAGGSLSKYISQHFGIVTKATSQNYTKSVISDWIEKFYDENGYYPTKRSGPIGWAEEEGYYRTTWNNVAACFNQGMKGLPISSLSKFIKDNAKRPIKHKSWYRKEKI